MQHAVTVGSCGSSACCHAQPWRTRGLRVRTSLMAKITKSLRKQADKAERAAASSLDPGSSASLMALARAYRAQADVIKSKKKKAHRKR